MHMIAFLGKEESEVNRNIGYSNLVCRGVYSLTRCSARTCGRSVLIDIYLFITIKSKPT